MNSVNVGVKPVMLSSGIIGKVLHGADGVTGDGDNVCDGNPVMSAKEDMVRGESDCVCGENPIDSDP